MFKKILLPIDLGDLVSAKKAVAAAVELGKISGATLHVLFVLPGYSMSIVSQYFPEGFEEESLANAAKQVQAFIDEAVPSAIESHAVVASGTAYVEILRVAEDSGCDLIVMASHRPELKDYLLGPNAARVVRHADCSVLVVRD
jgi:nucleotide-binding universal stress UspA family protein